MKSFKLIAVLFVLGVIFTSESWANVIVDDADSNAVSDDVFTFSSEIVPTGSGMVGDYELIACGVTPLSQDIPTFSDPSPGEWTELDSGACGFQFPEVCIHGIWGRFTDTEISSQITCSWSDPSFVFAAGSFRYNEVDTEDPIIAVACQNGAGEGGDIVATAPSVLTIAGSQVARIFTYRNLSTFTTDDFNSNNDIMGSFTSIAGVTSINVTMQGTTELFEQGGPTGEESIIVGQELASWRACTIALRMAVPEPRPIPTMSEWGFMAVAAFMGAAGVWYLRRRQAQDA